jgi:hypothetical protein
MTLVEYIEKGFNAIVGLGQTAECLGGEILGSDGNLQLNGNVCDAIKGGLICEWCASRVE